MKENRERNIAKKNCAYIAAVFRKIMTKTINIAKGTTDPRVEFISQDHSSQFTNLEHMYYNFRISNKR